MTEFWKSNKMHWCDVCKCWMNDTKQAIQNHERGMGHQENLKRKLRDMTRKADQEKRTQEHVDRSISKIEDAAQKQYLLDREAAELETGRWVWDAKCSYYYNAKYRWYFDPKTEWYYGGEPTPDWTQAPPNLPDAAKFGAAPHSGGPTPQRTAGVSTSAVASTSSAAAASSSLAAGPSASSDPSRKVVQKVVALPSHPLSKVGGHQGPTIGRVGAAKGLTDLSGSGAQAEAKRKREEAAGAAGQGRELSAEDAEALARREAARARVAQRTAQGYGFV